MSKNLTKLQQKRRIKILKDKIKTISKMGNEKYHQMAALKKKKKRKIKYKKFEFKLSEKQKKIIDKFCRARKVSPNKMIKAAIRDYIIKFADSLPEEDYISENQLQLFDVEEDQETFNQLEKVEEFKDTLF
jgi:hypothetical protein